MTPTHDTELGNNEQLQRPLPAVEPAAARSIFTFGCPLAAFLVPLKLPLAYSVLAPMVALWGISIAVTPGARALEQREKRVLVPLALFLCACAVSLLTGTSLLGGLSPMVSLVFFAGTIMVYLRHAPLPQTAAAIIAGQSIAAIHSVLESAAPSWVPALFQGKVTESGQLAVTVVIAVGLMWYFATLLGNRAFARTRIAVGLLLSTLLLALSFRNDLSLERWPSLGIAAAALILGFISTRQSLHASGAAQRVATLAAVQLPLLLSALVINLKRGPWLGVLAGTALFFAFYARRALALLIGVSALAVVALAPVRDRIAASYEHFTISGGRSTMWRIALDLAAEYPLGIGYHNSGVVRTLAPEIPPELKHFHNNLLNILAETGWLGAAFFIWLIVALLKCCFADRRNIPAVAMGCAIVSWQAAGLVEYNVGDSEVLILVWMLVGSLLFSLRAGERQPEPR
jgi:hypothetical protein